MDPPVAVGHVHLEVDELEGSGGFHGGVLGFSVTQRIGDLAVFLGAGDCHHHLALHTWGGQGAEPPPTNSMGLDHFALRYPDRASLADVRLRLRQAGIRIDGAADHGVRETILFRHPDGNGVKPYWDRAPDEWPRNEDFPLAISTRPPDLVGLRRHLDGIA